MTASCLSTTPRAAWRFRSPARGLMLGALLLGLYGALGAGTARAANSPRVVSIRQSGNLVIVKYFVPSNSPGFSRVQTRWNTRGTYTTNEHQQTFNLGYGSYFVYAIPSVRYNQRYVFKIQGYSGSWSRWNEVRFTTKRRGYAGPLSW